MTAVAPPPNFQNISRQSWNGSNGVPNGAPMSSDDYRQMFMPRKSVQRSNSSSSLNSNASSTSTVSTASQPNNLGATSSSGDASTWAARKKAPRGLWPASKTEPVSGLTNARPQSIASAGSGTSAASAMTALHSPAPMVPSQHSGAGQAPQNGASRPQPQESNAILQLIPMNGTFDRKMITVPFFPEVLRIGRQTNNKTQPTPLNGYFDSKVLSRSHAEIWADRTGKIWIRDVKSSNGTFVNGQRLSQENRDSDPHELNAGDMLELGIDIVSEDQKTIVHHKVAARVEHAGIYTGSSASLMDLNFEMENSQMQNMVGAGAQQSNMRSRTPSQGSMAGGRMQGTAAAMAGNASNMQQPRHPNFWLQPVTMEQVVKKLNAEIKAAKQQSQELQQTHQCINAMLSAEAKKEPNKVSPTSQVKVSPIKDIKNRFTEPPAPPPQQPLPEKPDGPSLRRSETEKPMGSSSPVRADSRISSLSDALSSAKKEIEAQNIRVRDLEALLTQERRAREDAEERASRLEQESLKTNSELAPGEESDKTLQEHASVPEQDGSSRPLSGSPSAPSIVDVATGRLQRRLENMMLEMSEMKQQMEVYRRRAEEAEAQSAADRKTLAEMIESIRENDAKKSSRGSKRRSRSDSELALPSPTPSSEAPLAGDEAEEGEITIVNENDLQADRPISQTTGHEQNGQPFSHETSTDLSNTARPLATRQPSRNELAITHGGPAVSILTVVALGVAVMAWLNSYPKVER